MRNRRTLRTSPGPARPRPRCWRSRRRAARGRRPRGRRRCPERPIATPMSASCSAGASLTPSPVIATTWPRDRRARAMRSLSSGRDPGDHEAVVVEMGGQMRSRAGRSAPVSTGSPGRLRPTSSAMARAVAGWSPVTMATLMPALRQAASASPASSPRWVLERHEAGQAEVALGLLRRAEGRPPGAPHGDGQDPEAPGGERLDGPGAPRLAAQREHRVRGALDDQPIDHDGHAAGPRGRRGTAAGWGAAAGRRRCRCRGAGRRVSSAASMGSPCGRHRPSTSTV